MITITKAGDWDVAARILATAPAKIRFALDRAVLTEAQFFRTKVVEGFREQAPGGQPFKPLSPMTLAIRKFRGFGGTKALIVRGDLRNSFVVVKRTTRLGAEAFVGVLRSARGRAGQKLVNIARIHEFGSGPIVIRVTPAMRRFLMAAIAKSGIGSGASSGALKRGVIVVRIPARPFLRPVAEKFFKGPEAASRFRGRVAENLGGMFGNFGNFGG